MDLSVLNLSFLSLYTGLMFAQMESLRIHPQGYYMRRANFVTYLVAAALLGIHLLIWYFTGWGAQVVPVVANVLFAHLVVGTIIWFFALGDEPEPEAIITITFGHIKANGEMVEHGWAIMEDRKGIHLVTKPDKHSTYKE